MERGGIGDSNAAHSTGCVSKNGYKADGGCKSLILNGGDSANPSGSALEVVILQWGIIRIEAIPRIRDTT